MALNDLLIAKLLDPATPADERARLERLVQRDPALAEEVSALRADDALLRELVAPEPPAGLSDRIMDAVRAEPAVGTERVAPAPWRRLALAASVILVAGVGALVALRGPGAGPEPAVPSDVASVQPERVDVRFVLTAEPGVRSVQVVGDFNGWGERRIDLIPTDTAGVFAAVVPVPKGEHQYLFLVDGERFMTDPAAVRTRPDGFGGTNSVLTL